jgi:hypothetical protein
MNGAHGCPITDVHPSPPQREAAVNVDPTHDAGLQIVPTGYVRHWPAPSQAPSRAQLPGISSGQSLRGSVPTSAGRQMPRLPAKAHDWQMPSQRVAQQTLSTQKPLPHSASEAQDVPGADKLTTGTSTAPASPPIGAPPVDESPPAPDAPPLPAPPDPATPPAGTPPAPMIGIVLGAPPCSEGEQAPTQTTPRTNSHPAERRRKPRKMPAPRVTPGHHTKSSRL